jgi:hypothetical protein
MKDVQYIKGGWQKIAQTLMDAQYLEFASKAQIMLGAMEAMEKMLATSVSCNEELSTFRVAQRWAA